MSARDPAAAVREALDYAFFRTQLYEASQGLDEPLIETKGQEEDARVALDALEQQLQQAQGKTLRMTALYSDTCKEVEAAEARAGWLEEALRTVLAECDLSDRLAAIVLEALAGGGDT